MKPSISVIIPSYNSTNFIGATLDSVLSQSVVPDEIIVVDDGSTDDSVLYIQKNYPTVKVIQQTNGGPSKARNTGIKNATSNYIAFLDADDYWAETKVEFYKNFFSKHPEIVWCVTNYAFKNWDNKANSKQFPEIINEPLQFFGKDLKIWTGAVAVKKKL